MKDKIFKALGVLLIALLVVYIIGRVARIIRWIAPMALELIILGLVIVTIVWFAINHKK